MEISVYNNMMCGLESQIWWLEIWLDKIKSNSDFTFTGLDLESDLEYKTWNNLKTDLIYFQS